MVVVHCSIDRMIGSLVRRKTWVSSLHHPFPRLYCNTMEGGGPTKKQKGESASLVGDVAVRYRLLKGSSIQDARLAMYFAIPTTFAESVLTVLKACQEKELRWSLGNEELPATAALSLPQELAVTAVPKYPALLYEYDDNALKKGNEKEALEEVDAVEILKGTDKNRLKRNHIIYHVYYHKRPYASWKAALKIDKDEHLVLFELLKEMVSERNPEFGECNQVLDVQLWSEAKVTRHSFSKCPPPVTDDMVERLEEDVARHRKDEGTDLMGDIDWNADFCLVSNATRHWCPDC